MSTIDVKAMRSASARPDSVERESAERESAERDLADWASRPADVSDPRPPGDLGRECEKLGLVEAILERERYGSILEFGCGTGYLARTLLERCDAYTGMDADEAALAEAWRQIDAGSPIRFVSLAMPLRLPPGQHELVILSEVLQLLDPSAVSDVARRLVAHAACREVVVIGARDECASGRDAALDAFVAALGGAFEHQELAVRRHYRIDALLRDGRTLP